MNKMIIYDILCIAMDLVVCIYICICICFFIYVLCYCAATDFSVNKDLYYRVGLWCREYQACVDISNFIPYVAAVMLPFAVSTATTCYHNVPR